MTSESNILEEICISDALKEYLRNRFVSSENVNDNNNEDSIQNISFWQQKLKEYKFGFDLLRKCYPQLNFQIGENIAQSDKYRLATLQGKIEETNESSLDLNKKQNIAVQIYNSFVGEVPVIVVSDDSDFEKIIQSLSYRNKPQYIPPSMGASLINGINNWEKITELKKEWLSKNPFGNWKEEFSKNILSNPLLYKDQLVVLSTKSYSNVSAKQLGISESLWKSYSLNIRKEHECTHLYTLKKYGTASNNLHDELIADYVGIVKTLGFYQEDWMFNFMGLENYPDYRNGARLENYINQEMSKKDFESLIFIIKNAIENISKFDVQLGGVKTNLDLEKRINALCEIGLLDIASLNGSNLLLNHFEKV